METRPLNSAGRKGQSSNPPQPHEPSTLTLFLSISFILLSSSLSPSLKTRISSLLSPLFPSPSHLLKAFSRALVFLRMILSTAQLSAPASAIAAALQLKAANFEPAYID